MFVKICGITRIEDAIAAADAGADAIGLNFYPESKRCVTLQRARAIATAVRGRVALVGLFVNAPFEAVDRMDRMVELDLLQFHGDETPAFCARWGGRVIRALRIAAESDLAQIAAYDSAHCVMLDAAVPGVYGGTGVMGEWALARKAVEAGGKIILAGGLTPENVAAAIETVMPFGVDTSSGVERAPGIKDHARIAAFISAARSAGAGQGHSRGDQRA